MGVLLAVNALVALGGAAASLAGVRRPGLILPAGQAVTVGAEVYVRAYAARAVPLGAVTALVLLLGPAAAQWPLLTVAGLAQAGDLAIGLRQRNTGMAIGSAVGAVLHLATAWWSAR